MIVCVENLKKNWQKTPHKTRLKLISDYSKATTYTLIYKSQSYILDTRNEQVEFEI